MSKAHRFPPHSPSVKNCKRHIVFLHLDLGIGGAEQLIVNLSLASLQSQDPPTTVSILTTHCDPHHCFDAVRPNSDGILSNSVHVVGEWLPVTIGGMGTALCSTLRILYLSLKAVQMFPDADVMVLDVLPTCIPYLIWRNVKCVIYYCHFPDKLLTRDTVNGVPVSARHTTTTKKERASSMQWLKQKYRRVLDLMEEWTMAYADLICVNSKFTKREVSLAFSSLSSSPSSMSVDDGSSSDEQTDDLQVLYPAIDLSKFIPPNFERKEQQLLHSDTNTNTNHAPIVSLNRFERKKNIQVLLYAYAKLIQSSSFSTSPSSIPTLIIAGGYDRRNVENVEYLQELQSLAQRLHIPQDKVHFRPSISDEERALLLQSALCVVYTPFREHFGIVPLEAMFAGSPVVAMQSGGPMETIVNGSTGILVPTSAEGDGDGKEGGQDALAAAMASALRVLLDNPQKAIEMGKRGHEHVKEKFGMEVFRKDWNRIVQRMAIPRAERRRKSGCLRARLDRWMYSIIVVMVALMIGICIKVTE